MPCIDCELAGCLLPPLLRRGRGRGQSGDYRWMRREALTTRPQGDFSGRPEKTYRSIDYLCLSSLSRRLGCAASVSLILTKWRVLSGHGGSCRVPPRALGSRATLRRAERITNGCGGAESRSYGLARAAARGGGSALPVGTKDGGGWQRRPPPEGKQSQPGGRLQKYNPNHETRGLYVNNRDPNQGSF